MMTYRNPRRSVAGRLNYSSRFLLAFFLGLLMAPSVSADYQCFHPFADTYAWDNFGSRRDENFGDAETLAAASLGDINVDQRRSYLRFNLDVIPSGATVLSADLELFLRDIAGTNGSTVTRLQAVTGNWTESSLTWNDQPTRGGTIYDQKTLSEADDAPGWIDWSADSLVDAWVGGSLTNRGLAISSGGLSSPAAIFDSSEAGGSTRPRLCVEWTTSAVSVDLTVADIEVTQGIQDLNNSVRLVAGKRTYVRVHIDSTNGNFRTFATLGVSNATDSVVLEPINQGAGHVVARPSPDREMLNQSFLFQLPSRFTDGNVALVARVNPLVSWRPSRYPPETSYSNNTRSTSVSFEEVPQIGVIGYLADYSVDEGGPELAEYSTPTTDFLQMIDWIKRAYPVSKVWYSLRRIDFGEVTVETDPDDGSLDFADPLASDVNAQLAGIRQLDLNGDPWFDDRVGDVTEIRYYGMVVDDGGFMRGRGGIPGNTSSGPTGDGTWGWDDDGSYGDWYGAHELGHNFDRVHAAVGCGSRGGGGYPYPDGRISPDLTGDGAIFGFDIGTAYLDRYATREQDIGIYGPEWRDVMSYCDNQWLSDFTYHGLMDYFQDNITAVTSAGSVPTRGTVADRLMVIGTIDPPFLEANMQPVFIVPDAVDPTPRVPGDHAIVLEGAVGNELARYRFTPHVMETGPPANDPDTPDEANLFISELVPYRAGTERILIEGPSGELARIQAGPAEPTVSVDAPNGGEIITADPVQVSWTGFDADSDSLIYKVQFSHDGGASWETVSRSTTATTVDIPRDNLASTENGLFRVWVSDGINTASDISDAAFELVSRPPEIRIVSPEDGIFVSAGQTLTLEASVFSPNFGAMANDQVVWLSSIDGILGNGEQLSVTGLSNGVHDIQVWANDGTLSFPVIEQINDITVVDNPSLLPAPRNELELGPNRLMFRPDAGQTAQTLYIDNLAGEEVLSWNAFPLKSWITMQATSGRTPAEITVTVDTSGLEPGRYVSRILIGSADTSGALKSIPVTLWTHEDVPGDMMFRDSFEP